MAVIYPLWYYLKQNIKYYLEQLAAEEKAIAVGRDFKVEVDNGRPYIEADQGVALVNIMVKGVNQNTTRSASRTASLNTVAVTLDMYVLGQSGGSLPSSELAAQRLDLLVAQTREGLSRLKDIDLGFKETDPVDPNNPTGPTWADIYGSGIGMLIDGGLNFNLTYYDQENEMATGQYASARWDFECNMPFIPVDNNLYRNLEELNLLVSDETLELFATKFTYDFS